MVERVQPNPTLHVPSESISSHVQSLKEQEEFAKQAARKVHDYFDAQSTNLYRKPLTALNEGQRAVIGLLFHCFQFSDDHLRSVRSLSPQEKTPLEQNPRT